MHRTCQYYLSVLSAFALMAPAVAADRGVSAAAANGTYRAGKSEIKILSAGPGKLKVEMNIVKPRDTGSASGEATIKDDVALFVSPDTDGCKITMTFLPDGSLKVEQEGRPLDCGFGRMAPSAAPTRNSTTPELPLTARCKSRRDHVPTGHSFRLESP